MTTTTNRIYEKLRDAMASTDVSFLSNNISTIDSDPSKWIQPGETTDADTYENTNYDIILDLIPNVTKEIPPEIQNEPDVCLFLNEFTLVTSTIYNHTISTKISWLVDLEEKFKWIAMMLAIKITHKVIPYIGKIIKDTRYVLEHADTDGHNCFTLASYNIMALFELINLYPNDYVRLLTRPTPFDLSPLDILTYTGGIIQILESRIIDFDLVVASYSNASTKMNLMHVAAIADNVSILEYLLTMKDIGSTLMHMVDINDNTPLQLSCIYSQTHHITAMIKSTLCDKEILEHKNSAGVSALSSTHVQDNISYFFDLLDEKSFSEYKFANYITTDELFQRFVRSKLFTLTSLSKELLFRKLSFLIFVLDCSDEGVEGVLRLFVGANKSFLTNSFDMGYKHARVIMRSRYMTSELLGTIESEQTLISKLVASNSDTLDAKELAEAIIENPHTCSVNITNAFVEYCAKYFPNLVEKLINRGFVHNMITVLWSIATSENAESIMTLFENGQIDIKQLRETVPLITKLMQLGPALLDFILQQELLQETIINIFTSASGIINVYSILPEGMSPGAWSLLLNNRALTTDKLNAFDEIQGSILNNIIRDFDPFSQGSTKLIWLQILNERRPDFDQKLFFKMRQSYYNFFLMATIISPNCAGFVMDNSRLFTKSEYDKISDNKFIGQLMFSIKANINTIEKVIFHPFFDEKVINIRFADDNNLLQHLIVNSFGVRLIEYVIGHQAMTEEMFRHENGSGNNCLMLTLLEEGDIGGGGISEKLFASKYFDRDMMLVKNANGRSCGDMLYDHMDYSFFGRYWRAFRDVGLLLRKYAGGNTLVHKLLEKRGDIDILGNPCEEVILEMVGACVREFGVDILLERNDNGDSCLHRFSAKYDMNFLLDILGYVRKEYFLVENELGGTVLGNIIDYGK
ncbi:MAG: ankyrin and ring finger domain protein, partial [Hyperionvirus sp.]